MRALLLALLLVIPCFGDPTICGVKPGTPLADVLRQHPQLRRTLFLVNSYTGQATELFRDSVSGLKVMAYERGVIRVSGRTLDFNGTAIAVGDSLEKTVALGFRPDGNCYKLQCGKIFVTIYYENSVVEAVSLADKP